MSKSRQKYIAIVVISVVALVWAGVGFVALNRWMETKTAEQSVLGSRDGNTVVTKEEADVAGLVKKMSPTVVSIVTTQQAGQGYFIREVEGAGTGIIISKDGYILTNKHVVSGARSVQVVTSDGTRYEDVTVVGADPLNDIAFLKIKGAENLEVASMGDSGTVRVGQNVIAIGNSLGQYQNTVTSGIISGLGRPVAAASSDLGSRVESLTDLLQTDAAINPGNSGGPLINMSGQVIGINTAIVSDAQSIGFAIPINAAKGLIRGILANGKVEKAYIGVQYISITPDTRAEYDLTQKQGAYVKQPGGRAAVIKGGPADKAGLKDGDIITKVGDKVVGEQGGLGSLVAEYLPGEKVKLVVVRDGKEIELSLTLEAFTQDQN